MQIQISWLLQKPTDLDLHCLQRQGCPSSARQGLSHQQAQNINRFIRYTLKIYVKISRKCYNHDAVFPRQQKKDIFYLHVSVFSHTSSVFRRFQQCRFLPLIVWFRCPLVCIFKRLCQNKMETNEKPGILKLKLGVPTIAMSDKSV